MVEGVILRAWHAIVQRIARAMWREGGGVGIDARAQHALLIDDAAANRAEGLRRQGMGWRKATMRSPPARANGFEALHALRRSYR